MSAISCVYHLDGQPLDRELLLRMIQISCPFGPDCQTRWLDKHIGLGYCGLWTVEESLGESQPVSDVTGTVRIVCDGRIDNRKQLGDELGRSESKPYTDAELLLAAYSTWGTACAARIVGDFAFVVWDSARQRLFCARDALGVRSLFYAFDGQTFFCGSLIRQLLQDRSISRQLDEEFMANFLVRGDSPGELTPYQGIKRLLGGWSIVIENGVLKKTKYWDLDPHKTIQYSSDDEYEQHFRCVFREAVSARLRSCGPVASDLSGGLDSSSIVCMAQDIYQSGDVPDNGFYVLTQLFDQAVAAKEGQFSREVIDKYKLRVEYFSGEAHWSLKDHHEGALYWDEPTLKGLVTSLLQEVGNRLIRGRTRVLLSGIGGDQVFLGDTTMPLHLVDEFRRFRWKKLGEELRAWQKFLKRPLLQVFLENCVLPFQYPNSMLLPAFRDRGGVPDWIDPHFSRKYDLRRRGPLYGFLPQVYKSPAAQRQYLLIKRTSAPLLQWHLANPELEARFPYLDRRLVEFAMAIPMTQKLRVGETRSILRRGMRGILPEKIRTRRGKAVFDQASSISLQKEWKMVSQLTSSPHLASLGMIDPERLHSAAESASLGLLKDSYLFWAALSLELWLRTLLREQSVRPITSLGTININLATYPPIQTRA